jgi:hypothetical protein
MVPMLERLDEGLWTVTRPLKVLGLTLASRMTVVRLGDGSLFLHSPVRLEPGLRQALDALGPVGHVVAPNRMHHLFCGDYLAAYPQARLHGAPGIARKRPDLMFAGELGDEVPTPWAGEIDQALVGGIPMLNEVVFLHRPSGALVLTDLAANGGPDDPPALRLWLRLNRAYGRLATPLEVRLLCRDRAAARRGVERALGWAFERVVVGHGAIVERDGRRRAREAFAWLS